MRWLCTGLLGVGVCIVVGCMPNAGTPTPTPKSLASKTLVEARKGFVTNLTRKERGKDAPESPPPTLFQLVKYDAPVGPCSAYLTPNPKNGKKNPAIVWITGGDCNSIGDVWSPAPAKNDQTASAFRKAGIVMMYPSLRGGNDNPGVKEGFLGEVDDVIAAYEYLRKLDYVDPKRIYLGGHSTGGTLALLVAECTDRFRAIFSFGPVDNVMGYGNQYCPFNILDEIELGVRSPGVWLKDIRNPTFVIEGAKGNQMPLQGMEKKNNNSNANLHILEVPEQDHFSVLGPSNVLLAQKILADTGPECTLAVTVGELAALFRR